MIFTHVIIYYSIQEQISPFKTQVIGCYVYGRLKSLSTIFQIYWWDQYFIDAENQSPSHTSSHLAVPPPRIRIEHITLANCINIHLPYDRDFDGAYRIIEDMGLWSRCLTPLSPIFQLFVADSFIDGGNRRNHRPAASHWQTLYTPRFSRIWTRVRPRLHK